MINIDQIDLLPFALGVTWLYVLLIGLSKITAELRISFWESSVHWLCFQDPHLTYGSIWGKKWRGPAAFMGSLV